MQRISNEQLKANARKFEILTRPERFGLAIMYNNESAWMGV